MTHPTDDSLKPCPFCGAGTTEITPKGRMWTGMKYSEPSSVSVRHWCEAVPGQPSRMIERVGRDEASAIDAWNTRALLAEQARTEPVGYVVLNHYSPGNHLFTSFSATRNTEHDWKPVYLNAEQS